MYVACLCVLDVLMIAHVHEGVRVRHTEALWDCFDGEKKKFLQNKYWRFSGQNLSKCE